MQNVAILTFFRLFCYGNRIFLDSKKDRYVLFLLITPESSLKTLNRLDGSVSQSGDQQTLELVALTG